MKNDDYQKDLIGEISDNHRFDDEIKRNPGYGKPLPSMAKGDVYSNFLKTAKEAGFLPPWLKLQKEIKEQLDDVLERIEKKDLTIDHGQLIEDINKKIKKYNQACPPSLQRRLIEYQTIQQQYKIWE